MFLILRKFLICDITEIKKKKTESTLALKKKKNKKQTTFGIAVRLFLLKYFLLIQIHGQMCEYEGCEGM